MSNFRLFWRDQELGRIVDLSADQPEMYGTLESPKLAASFHKLYEFLANEDNDNNDPPIDAELLDDEDWYLLDGVGTRWDIFFPAISPDDFSIIWRWRGPIPEW